MKVDDGELFAVCLAMAMLIAIPTGLLVGVWPLSAAAAVVLAGCIWRLTRLAARPDPWRTFDRALAEMGVVVAGSATPPSTTTASTTRATAVDPAAGPGTAANQRARARYTPTALNPPST